MEGQILRGKFEIFGLCGKQFAFSPREVVFFALRLFINHIKEPLSWFYCVQTQYSSPDSAIVGAFCLPANREFVVSHILKLHRIFYIVWNKPGAFFLRPRVNVFFNVLDNLIYFFLQIFASHAHILSPQNENDNSGRKKKHNDRVVHNERKNESNDKETDHVAHFSTHEVAK